MLYHPVHKSFSPKAVKTLKSKITLPHHPFSAKLWVRELRPENAEIFVLKLGFPLACVGLVNADGGVFTLYRGKLFKSMLTVLVQILCCKLALLLVFSGQLIYAIAMIILAIKTPKMLQEFMLGGGGGGISNVIVTASKTMELSGQLSRKIKQLKKVKW